MSEVHKCDLPLRDTSGLKKLSPNASYFSRLGRKIRKQTILNPNNFRCKNFYPNMSAILSEQRRHVTSPYNYIIHPFSNLSSWLQAGVFIFWLVRMCYVPLVTCMLFDDITLHIISHFTALMTQPIVTIIFFFLGYIDYESGEIILDHRKIVAKYLKTYFFFDLFTSEVLDLFVKWTTKDYYQEHFILSALLVDCINILALYVRLNTILNFLDNIGELLHIRHGIRYCIHIFVKTSLYIHFFSCMMYMIPHMVYIDEWPKDSWLVLANIDPAKNAPLYRRYGECLIMAAFNFFGASEGFYDVKQTNEQIVLSFVGFFGRLYTLFVLADILRSYDIVGFSEGTYEKHTNQLRTFMVVNNFPQNLRDRINRYFEQRFQRRYFDEKEILEHLSERLRDEIYLYSARNLINKSTLLRMLPKKQLATFISKMKPETLAPGTILFTHDVYTAFFICSGTVAIFTREGLEVCHLQDGDIFGLIRHMTGMDSYVAVVLETTDVFTMDAEELYRFLQPYEDALSYMRDLLIRRQTYYEELVEHAQIKSGDAIKNLEIGNLLEDRQRRIGVYSFEDNDQFLAVI